MKFVPLTFDEFLRQCTVPNVLTTLRLLLSPVIGLCLIHHYLVTASILFCCAAVTDFFDGYLARRLKQESTFGAALDPIADKCLLLITFTSLAWNNYSKVIIPSWFLSLMFFKEIIIVGGFLWLFLTGRTIKIQPTKLGKFSTAVHIAFIVFIFGMLCDDAYFIPLLYPLLFISSVVLLILALIQYVGIGIISLLS